VHSCNVFVVDNVASKVNYITRNSDAVQNGVCARDSNSNKKCPGLPSKYEGLCIATNGHACNAVTRSRRQGLV